MLSFIEGEPRDSKIFFADSIARGVSVSSNALDITSSDALQKSSTYLSAFILSSSGISLPILSFIFNLSNRTS